MPNTIDSFRELFRLLPKQSYVAARLDVKHHSVRAWLYRQIVPVAYWDQLLDLSHEHGINVTRADFNTWSIASKSPAKVADSSQNEELIAGAAYEATDLA